MRSCRCWTTRGRIGAEVRFIEYMDVGGATRWSPDRVCARARDAAGDRGVLRPGHAHRRRLMGAGRSLHAPGRHTFGIISSTTEPFCRTCDRSRLTADGLWFRCLYARDGTDLRALLRSGASDEAIRDVIAATWSLREDRGAELRAAERERTPVHPGEPAPDAIRIWKCTRGGAEEDGLVGWRLSVLDRGPELGRLRR